ncbi:ribonucleotide reductase [Escherichia coli]
MPSETFSQISNATNGIEPPRGYVSIKASKDGILRQVVLDDEHLHDAYELLWEMPGNDGYLQLVGIMRKLDHQSISADTTIVSVAIFPSRKSADAAVAESNWLTAYKFGSKHCIIRTPVTALKTHKTIRCLLMRRRAAKAAHVRSDIEMPDAA